ncbi:MAG: molybdate ABC transporter, inner rane subunit [Gammaproteobacteria bacterium]|nr:molybdate ABC transporter, inner rane subunit [Gammaproteobacteria bacterium]
MDWQALNLSLTLGLWTAVLLIPAAILLARLLAWRLFPGRSLVQALLALPLLLPPTVLGFYLLTAFGNQSIVGKLYAALAGDTLVFSFHGILLASIIFNIPFAVQPIQRAFESVPVSVREAAWCSGLSNWQTFWRIELPLAWPGVLTALVLTFAHTLGEFGVVLMVGGNIPGATRTIAIAIYDRVQAFDNASASIMSAVLLAIAFLCISLIYFLNDRLARRHAQ